MQWNTPHHQKEQNSDTYYNMDEPWGHYAKWNKPDTKGKYWMIPLVSGLQFSSVAQLCPTLCDPMDCSRPGLPVHHQLPEFTQTHVHWVNDAIQPSHPLLSPSPPALNFPSIRVFSNASVLHIRWPKYWSFSFSISPSNEYSGLIYFRMDWFDLLAVQGTLKSLLKKKKSSPRPQFKSINSLALE